MTSPQATCPAWLTPVAAALEREARRGRFLVAFDIYRPDLARAMAHALRLQFIDFRAQYMMPLGRDAGRLPLARIEELIADAEREPAADGEAQGLVLLNVEALLATRPAQERITWMQDFIARPSAVPVIVPVSVFAAEAPAADPRVVAIDPAAVPSEKLLFRLAGQ